MLTESPHNVEVKVKPKTPKIYICFLPKVLHKEPRLIIPIADDIEKTVITHEVTELVIEKLLSMSIKAIETMPMSIVNKLVARLI